MNLLDCQDYQHHSFRIYPRKKQKSTMPLTISLTYLNMAIWWTLFIPNQAFEFWDFKQGLNSQTMCEKKFTMYSLIFFWYVCLCYIIAPQYVWWRDGAACLCWVIGAYSHQTATNKAQDLFLFSIQLFVHSFNPVCRPFSYQAPLSPDWL